MGRHVMGLSPGVKPRYRFVVALAGIVAMAAATLVVASAIAPKEGEADTLATATPGLRASALAYPSLGPDLVPSPTGPVNAVYAMPPDGVTATGFQAQITLNNPTAEALDWEVKLVFADGVTELTRSWLDGVPVVADPVPGPEFSFTGTSDLGAGLTTVLRLEFSTSRDADITVRLCTANGRPCSRV